MTITQQTLIQSQVSSLILNNVDGVKYIPDLTQEILLVFDKSNQLSLFWNPVTHLWKVSRIYIKNIVSSSDLSTEELIQFLKNGQCQELMNEIFAIQHRTMGNAKIYRRDL